MYKQNKKVKFKAMKVRTSIDSKKKKLIKRN